MTRLRIGLVAAALAIPLAGITTATVTVAPAPGSDLRHLQGE